MNKNIKPTGYNSVSPYFIVNGAQRLIDLMKNVFDAEELRRFERADGKIMHAEVKIDDSVIMLADATEQWPAIIVVIHVYVADVDRVFEKAMSAGCESVQVPKEQEGDPDRRGTFKDFAGNLWSIGMQVSA